MPSSHEARLRQLQEQRQARYKASGTNPGISPTGPNGLFNTPGLDPNIISTYIPPEGLEEFLEANGHVRITQYSAPDFGIITGQTTATGENPTEPCDENVPVAGSLKLCQQSWPLGEMTLKSQVIRLDNAGTLINRSDMIDGRLVNDPFNSAVASQISTMRPEDILRSTVAKLTLELANDFKRQFAQLIWDGNPVNTAGSSGGYIEFNGLNRIINTGYRDSVTQTLCPAADSLVQDFNDAIVQNNPANILRTFVETYRDRTLLSRQTRFGAVTFAWVMRRQLFLALTEVWPCAYYTYRCYTPSPEGATVISLSGTEQAAFRDEMRIGQFLLIDGQRVPVIIDETLDEINHANGNFSSNAYLVPLSAPGRLSDTNGQLTYIEYFDYRGQFGMMGELARLGIVQEGTYRVSPDGRFIAMLMSPVAFCRQILMRTRKRIICRTPFLAARIDNIQYNVYIHERDWNHDSSFFVNGGNTSFTGQTFYSPVG